MKDLKVFHVLFLVLWIGPYLSSAHEVPLYDDSAYTECKANPEEALYNGGILKNEFLDYQWVAGKNNNPAHLPVLRIENLAAGTFYSFSSWVRIHDVESALVRVSLVAQTTVQECIGTVIAKSGCWSFLKGGFVLDSPSNASALYFQTTDGKNVKIDIASSALQPFSKHQWQMVREDNINKERKRAAVIHVSNSKGVKLKDAKITIKQVTKDFHIGAAIGKTLLGSSAYQNWFVKRFTATVFENELKWGSVEPHQNHINYTLADQMMEFVRANKIIVRGRSNIFWEDPMFVPKWVHNLTGIKLHSAVNSRVQSVMSKYKEELIHWDIGQPRFFDAYEQRIGRDATSDFIQTAHEADPLATLFINEFNVVETCSDVSSTVDTFITKIKELRKCGISMNGIALEGHFSVPNPPLMRAVLDKLATLGLPIWLTEVDISKTIAKEKQAIYLEEVMREGFSHPAVKGIMLWVSLSQNGCYQTCLTDNKFQNLPAGDAVDKLLNEWQTGILEGQTDDHGSFSFDGFLGEYEVTARYGKKTVNATFSLSKGGDTRQIYLHL